jgi:hypothetical protein
VGRESSGFEMRGERWRLGRRGESDGRHRGVLGSERVDLSREMRVEQSKQERRARRIVVAAVGTIVYGRICIRTAKATPAEYRIEVKYFPSLLVGNQTTTSSLRYSNHPSCRGQIQSQLPTLPTAI